MPRRENRLFLHPDLSDDLPSFIKPTHHEIVEFSWEKKAGLSLHICGYIDPIIEDILDLGIAALSLGSSSSLKRTIFSRIRERRVEKILEPKISSENPLTH